MRCGDLIASVQTQPISVAQHFLCLSKQSPIAIKVIITAVEFDLQYFSVYHVFTGYLF